MCCIDGAAIRGNLKKKQQKLSHKSWIKVKSQGSGIVSILGFRNDYSVGIHVHVQCM